MTQLLTIFNKLTEDTLFMYYQALYWYASENHEGQFSALYSILSTLPYKPSLTEKAEDVDFDSLGFPISHDNMLLLATALRLYSLLHEHPYSFAKLHYFAAKNIYLAEHRNYWNEDGEYDTRYAIYFVDEDGTIEDQTLID